MFELSASFTLAFLGLASTLAARTQNAPSKIAPTKANTAHTASTFHFKARSTAVPPLLIGRQSSRKCARVEARRAWRGEKMPPLSCVVHITGQRLDRAPKSLRRTKQLHCNMRRQRIFPNELKRRGANSPAFSLPPCARVAKLHARRRGADRFVASAQCAAAGGKTCVSFAVACRGGAEERCVSFEFDI